MAHGGSKYRGNHDMDEDQRREKAQQVLMLINSHFKRVRERGVGSFVLLEEEFTVIIWCFFVGIFWF